MNDSVLTIERRTFSTRTLLSATLTALTALATAVALVPLVSIAVMLVQKGAPQLSMALFTQPTPTPLSEGGGIGNALVGTLVMVGLASLISVPLGLLAAIYLAEFGGDSKTASFIRFSARVLSGLPSIIAGVFAYALVVMAVKRFNAVAGGVALALLMVPFVTLTAEQALRAVPNKLRDAALGLGATPTQTVFFVVLPTAFSSLATGVLLAVARAAGETAPLLFTALFSFGWMRSAWEEAPSMAVMIYQFSSSPYANQIQLAWAGSLVLVTAILLLNIVGRSLSRTPTQ
jgi:phosphate transport system permease protein